MTLRYYFNDYDENDVLDYELDVDDLSRFFETVSDEAVAEAAEEVFYSLTEQEQDKIINMWEEDDDGLVVTTDVNNKKKLNFLAMVQIDRGWVLSELVEFGPNEKGLELFEDELKRFFKDEAYEYYKEHRYL